MSVHPPLAAHKSLEKRLGHPQNIFTSNLTSILQIIKIFYNTSKDSEI